MFENRTQSDASDPNDPLGLRVAELKRYQTAALAPLLEYLNDLLEDSRRQYDPTITKVITCVRDAFVDRLELAVMADHWISVRTAAERVRKPTGTIRYWCRKRKVSARKVGARAWEVDAQSLYRYDEGS